MKAKHKPQPKVHQDPTAPLPEQLATPVIPRRWRIAILAAILIAAAALRLVNLGQSPPGLNQDESAEAWNSWCLLKTGTDQVGVSWPIFYTRALGSNFPTLYMYMVMPFQAIGGMNVVTTRLPSALGGILTVLLIYYVGRRLWGDIAGLLAAALLTFNPWHLYFSRWGAQSNISPLLTILPFALMLAAGLPPGTRDGRKPCPGLSALAGLITGICCYGYTAVRLFLPAFLVVVTLICWRAWWQLLKDPKARLAVAAFALGVAVTFGPLAYKQLTDTEISKRGQTELLWKPGDSTGDKIAKVASRYFAHFDPDFLFVHGDLYPVTRPPEGKQFHWYMLPLMLLGAAYIAANVRRSKAARILLAGVLLFPISDSFFSFTVGPEHTPSMHSYRSSPGLWMMILFGAVGGASAGLWLWRRKRAALLACAGALLVLATVINVRYLGMFFGEFNRRDTTYHLWHMDLVSACQWLRPQMDSVDSVFITTTAGDPTGKVANVTAFNIPYIVTLVAMDYDPRAWFAGKPKFVPVGTWDHYYHYGKMNFLYPYGIPGERGQAVPVWWPSLMEAVQNPAAKNVLFVIRPWDAPMFNQPGSPIRISQPIKRFTRPDGAETLWVCRLIKS